MDGQLKSTKSGPAKPSSRTAAKVSRPHKEFEHPTEVVADPNLSRNEKVTALDSLEQDARQLSVASGEGMSGGEDTKLREVLLAKETLQLPPSEVAFAVVLQQFEAKLAETQGTDVHRVISQAIDAIGAARKAIERMEQTPALPLGAAKPGSKQELNEELAKEKLDP